LFFMRRTANNNLPLLFSLATLLVSCSRARAVPMPPSQGSAPFLRGTPSPDRVRNLPSDRSPQPWIPYFCDFYEVSEDLFSLVSPEGIFWLGAPGNARLVESAPPSASGTGGNARHRFPKECPRRAERVPPDLHQGCGAPGTGPVSQTHVLPLWLPVKQDLSPNALVARLVCLRRTLKIILLAGRLFRPPRPS
jgi:hypothetical protein